MTKFFSGYLFTYLSIFTLISAIFFINVQEPARLSPKMLPDVLTTQKNRIITVPIAHPKPTLAGQTSQPDIVIISHATLFAYSSTPDQTNGDPFITASGQTVRWGIVANNCLPFGTVITFPEAFGDQMFIVQDRMAARYGCESFDIWFPGRTEALQFGRQTSSVMQ